MSHLIVTHFLAAGYNCDAYGVSAYGECATTTASSGQTGSSPIGWLADTGYDILLPLALALAIILAGGILAIKTILQRKGQK